MGRRYEYEVPSFRLGYCAMSGEILKTPVVGCQLGRMYNKASIRKHFLMRISLHNKTDRKFNHIKQLGDVKRLNLTPNEKKKTFLRRAKNIPEAKFMCPITKEPLDEDHNFAILWTCGCVYSKQGIQQLNGFCQTCKKAFTPNDVVTLAPNRVEEEKMRDKIEKSIHESVPALENIVPFQLGCCAMSGEPLRPPIVGCQFGRMYNRSSIRKHFKNIIKFPEMVDKNFSYIKLPSDVKILNLAYNPKYKKRPGKPDTFSTQFICPVTSLAMDGTNKFAFLWSCGCVYSKEGLDLINGLCPNCQKVYTAYDIIPLDPSKQELKELRSRMEAKMPSITSPPPPQQNVSREPSIILITRNRLSTTSTISQISEKFQRHMVGIITIMIVTIVLVCIMTVTALL